MSKKNDRKQKPRAANTKKTAASSPEMLAMRARHSNELNDFLARNRFYAYNDAERFAEGMRRLGLEPEDLDKIVDVGGGAMRKDKIPELRSLLARHKREIRNLKRSIREHDGSEDVSDTKGPEA